MPAAVITAFWALESDFGAGIGNKPVLKSLATLAWDCRRGEMFREEFHAALRIIDRGDLVPAEMISSWAGELGQTQFLPTHYDKNAVDYDGDGKRNLFKSAPDIIGSTANFIHEPRLEEGRAVARGSARAGHHGVGAGGPRHQAAALVLGQAGRDARQRPAAAG